MKDAISASLIGIIFGVIVLVALSCYNADNNLQYETVIIEGMTCIKWNGGQRAGLTCNWDEWEKIE